VVLVPVVLVLVILVLVILVLVILVLVILVLVILVLAVVGGIRRVGAGIIPERRGIGLGRRGARPVR